MKGTIKSGALISALFDSGERIKTPYVNFIFGSRSDCEASNSQRLKNLGGVAFLAGKKNGNAVWRNASKRRMRALCGDLGGPWKDYDVLFLAKANLMKQPYYKVLNACRKALRRSPFIV